jgi:hypothetical protein
MSYTGKIRLKNLMGMLVLQVQEESGWRNAKSNEFSSNFKFISKKLADTIPYTDDELKVLTNLLTTSAKAEKKLYEEQIQKGTSRVIKRIRRDLPKAKPNQMFGELLSYDLDRLEGFDLKAVKEAFPNLRIYINGNDTSSGDPSLEVGLKR